MTLFMAVVLVTQLSAKVNGQNTAVNLTLKNVSVEEALSRVEKQLDVNFFFNRENVDLEREVSVELKDAGMEELIEALFGEGFKYRMEGNLVVVSRAEEEIVPQQQIEELRITGRVKDNLGHVLPGVTVLVKGTSIGVATDVDGKYDLTVPAGDHTLLFSMVGMKTPAVICFWNSE